MAAPTPQPDQGTGTEGTREPQSGQESPEGTQTPDQGQEGSQDVPSGSEQAPEGDQQDSFPRAYVERLRRENASYRERASRAQEALSRLQELTVARSTRGILADPTDLAYDAESMETDGWPDAEKIAEQARNLVERKPHLADRRPTGDIGQGARKSTDSVSLADILRSRA